MDDIVPFDELDVSFVYGPRELKEPAFSFAVDYVVFHTPEAIADAVLAVPNTRLIHDASDGWWNWLARWQVADRYIEIGNSDCDVDPACGFSVLWGGSDLTLRCNPEDLLTLWLGVRTRLDGIWLHDTSCRLWSPELFRRTYVR